MKRILILSILFFSTHSFGAEDKSATKKLDTNVSFDDLLIQGKYQFSDEVVTTVEQDKVLDSLLGIRKDFKDRIQRSAAKH